VGGAPLTLLPPRHCLYAPRAAPAPPPEEEGRGGAEESDGDGADSDGADAPTVARRPEERERRKAEGGRRQAAAESLADAHGVPVVAASTRLARHDGSEERASAALERAGDRAWAGADDHLA
jgi:hypothetical protein